MAYNPTRIILNAMMPADNQGKRIFKMVLPLELVLGLKILSESRYQPILYGVTQYFMVLRKCFKE